MNKTINIGIPIDLQKLMETRALIQAGSGGGKSYLLRKLIESIGSQGQQIVIDPEGEFVTLREKFDFALVAKGGEIPLNLKYAEALAHKLLETNISVIIDLYELRQDERILFVKRFLNALMNAPKELWHPCFVHIDEAHIFCPESSKSESMSAVIDLCTRGRKRGFVPVLATQRLSKLHKDAAAECNNKLIGLTGLDIDRKRAGDELGMTVKADMLKLRELQPGEFFAFGPGISNEVIKFKVSEVLTTHLQSGKRYTSPPPTPGAIKKILSKLSDIPEEAEKELATKQQFQTEIKRLQAELHQAKKNSKTAPAPALDPKKLQAEIDKAVAIAQITFKKEYVEVIKERDNLINQVKEALPKAVKEMQRIAALVGIELKSPVLDCFKIDTRKYNSLISLPANNGKTVQNSGKSVQKVQTNPAANNSNATLTKCAAAIFQFLYTYEERTFKKVQIAVATGYSPTSSGFANALSELNVKELIYKEGDRIGFNISEAMNDYTSKYTVQSKTYSADTFKEKLGKCEREIYEVLLANPDSLYTREEIANATPTKYSVTSSGFANAISSLNVLELIKKEGTAIRLNPELLELM